MTRLGWMIAGAAACLVLAGCASATSPSALSSLADNGPAAVALRTAAEKTLDSQSFRARSTFSIPSGSGAGSVEYQAPDREHMRWGTGNNMNQTITIGDVLYVTALGQPGYFWRIEGHGKGASDTLMYLRYLENAENVQLDGDQYRFDVVNPDGPGEGMTEGVATLTDDGFISTLLYRYQLAGDDVSVGFTYRDYNSGITVEPPPAHLIVKQNPLIGCPNSASPSDVLPSVPDICALPAPTPSS